MRHLFASSQGTPPWAVQKTEYSAPWAPTTPSQTTKRRGYSSVVDRRKPKTRRQPSPSIDSPPTMAVDERLRATTGHSKRYAFLRAC